MYGPTTAATDEEMERFYQDLSQAVKHVPNRDMLLIMGDFNDKDGRREPSTNKLDQLLRVSRSRLWRRPSIVVATVKVSLAKRQRQHSIPPLNLVELKEEKV